jgi:flagellar FliL protein
MVDEALESESEFDEEETEEDESPPRKRMSGKKLVLLVVLPLLLLGGGGAGVYFSGLIDAFLPGGSATDDRQQVASKPRNEPIFFEVPEMLVNLNSKGRRSSFLKIRIALEIEAADQIPELEKMLPRIVDNFQVYLRELRLDDLRGSAGMQRLREELLLRVNTAVEPIRVHDVLFKEMLVQ